MIPLDKLAKLYIDKIVSQYWTPVSIVLDRDPRFTSKFLPKLQHALRNKLHFNAAFHPKMDNKFEKIIQTFEDMLRAYILKFKGS